MYMQWYCKSLNTVDFKHFSNKMESSIIHVHVVCMHVYMYYNNSTGGIRWTLMCIHVSENVIIKLCYTYFAVDKKVVCLVG